ncbi:hypothetical protein WICPIJ_000013 [Wickerhamomyces pijperi]|uniref:Protein DML1 n=1 Tax=Wickerhamomyces pijperi TaxID=599730 RepID=A0A9P8TSM7_WICPI|nr:hypothetical protein WICPIJ_000013 [Wickerhamomyces pijperi]
MQEVLTLSLSQRSNNLTTHFYNAQESYFEYTKTSSDSSNDPTVHFRPSLQSNNTVNYHPRALIWDLNGGFGSLGKFEYFPQRDNNDDDPSAFNQTVMRSEKIRKSAYQEALDSGLSPLPALKSQDIQYWSDFNRVVFEPKSFNVLNDWVYDPVNAPDGRFKSSSEREFKSFEIGAQEWEKVGLDFLEEKYRVSLEECDALNGLNVVTDLDSAWGGFTASMLSEIRDDYNPKSMIFNWGLFNGKTMKELSNREVFNRIKTFVEINKSSSLFIPLGGVARSGGSLWETSAYQNVIFETVQILNSQRSDRINFNNIEGSLVRGTHRTVVSDVSATIKDEETGESKAFNLSLKFFECFKKDNRDNHQFNAIKVNRPSQNMPLRQEENKDNQTEQKLSPLTTTTTYKIHKPYPTPSSHPQNIITPDCTTSISLSMESNARRTFLDMKDWISKAIRGDERTELIDELSTLAAEYESGWGYSDESDDDY